MAQFDPHVRGEATISPCGQYRPTLTRIWDETRPRIVFVMLNPSTADANENDQTITKCIGFAMHHGAGGIEVANLYPYRATDPQDLWSAGEKFGPGGERENLHHIRTVLAGATDVVVAWGNAGHLTDEAQHVLALLADVGMKPLCIGVTAKGAPKHPARPGYGALVPYQPPRSPTR